MNYIFLFIGIVIVSFYIFGKIKHNTNIVIKSINSLAIYLIVLFILILLPIKTISNKIKPDKINVNNEFILLKTIEDTNKYFIFIKNKKIISNSTNFYIEKEYNIYNWEINNNVYFLINDKKFKNDKSIFK